LNSKIPQVVAVASDRPGLESEGVPVFHIDDVTGIAGFVIAFLKLAPSP
jgi:hypothetical protein